MNGNILDTNVIIRIIKGDNVVAEQARKLKSARRLPPTSSELVGAAHFGASLQSGQVCNANLRAKY